MSKLSDLITQRDIIPYEYEIDEDNILRLVYDEEKVPADLTEEEQLLHAITSDNLSVVQALLAKGVDVKISHSTPFCEFRTKFWVVSQMVGECHTGFLAWALLLGNLDIAELLVNNGASMDERTAMQVMRMVFFRGDFEALNFMLDRLNIDINLSTSLGDGSSYYGRYSSPLLHEFCKLFLCHFKSSLEPDIEFLETMCLLLKALLAHKPNLNLVGPSKKIPLDYIIKAFSKCNLLHRLPDQAFEFLELLLQSDIDVNHIDDSGKTLIKTIHTRFVHSALRPDNRIESNFFRLSQLLLKQGAMIDEENKLDLFFLALRYKDSEIIELLQEKCGLDINEPILGTEITLLAICVKALLNEPLAFEADENLDGLKLLLNLDADPNAIGVPRETDLQYRGRQLSESQIEVFALLLRYAQLRTVWNESQQESEMSEENSISSKSAGKEEELHSEKILGSMRKSYLEYLPLEMMQEIGGFIMSGDEQLRTVPRGQAMSLAKSMSEFLNPGSNQSSSVAAAYDYSAVDGTLSL